MARLELVLLLLAATVAPGAAEEQKAENATLALADAEAVYKQSVEHAQDALHKLAEFVKTTRSQQAVQTAATLIEEGATLVTASELKIAQDSFQGRLSEVAAAKGEDLQGLAEQAERAADSVKKVQQKQARLTRSIWAQMQKDKKSEAKSLYEEGKKAAKEIAKTAKSLEHAQRRAGVKESDFEQAADHNKDAASKMEDRVKDLHDEADNSIEKLYGKIELLVERHSDDVNDEASRHHEGMRKSIQVAVREAHKKETEQAEEKAAATKDQASLNSQAARQPEAAPNGASAHGEAPAPADFSSLASLRPAADDAWAPGAVGLLIMASAIFSLAAAFVLPQRRRSLRESPPLLG